MPSQYSDFQSLGDRILDAKGAVSLPFFANDRYFYVVLDKQKRKIYTEPDSRHHFRVRYDITGFSPKCNEHSNEAHWALGLVPFDLSFEKIQGLTQKANDYWGTLKAKSYALKFDPEGFAPGYALMTVVHCQYGEAAQKTATKKLGDFVLHVLDNKNIRSELVDPVWSKNSSRPESSKKSRFLILINVSVSAAFN